VLAHWPTQGDPAGRGWSDIAEGDHPVVIFGHAQVAQDCSVYDRYRRLHRDWASRGWVVLSVAAGGSLCGSMDAQNLEGRTALMESAWASLDALDAGHGELGPFLAGALDPSQLVLAGHSRGGGAALLAGGRAADEGRPLAGVVALQPVDPAAWELELPPLTAPVLLVLAERDSDVSALHTASLPDAFAGRWGLVDVPGGVHAWTADDLPPRRAAEPGTTAAAQRALTDTVAGRFLDELPAPSPWQWADEVEELSEPPVRMRWGGQPDALLVDDFDDADPSSGPLGAHTTTGELAEDEGVPFAESQPGRHGRSRWRWVEGTGRLELGLGQPMPGDRYVAELHAILDNATTLSAALGGPAVPLAVPSPGAPSLVDGERAVLLQAELDNHGSASLALHVDGAAWIDQVMLLPAEP
jgi:dienelactone hydrolase